MDAKQDIKMMQVGIVFKVVGMTVMSVRVLMLPHDGIAQKRHGPNTHVVHDRMMTADGKVTGIVTQGTNEPTKDGQTK